MNNDVLITGAGSGVGFAVAMQQATSGKRVFALSRNGERLRQLQQKAALSGGKVIPVVMDISTYEFSELSASMDANHSSGFSAVLHNAGQLLNKPFEQLTIADWQHIYSVNVFAVAALTRHVLAMPRRQEHIHIVMVSSMGGITGSVKFPGLSAYSSSKGAVSIMAECLGAEYQGQGATVNCLALGAVQTEMLSKAFPGYAAGMQPEEMAFFIGDFMDNGWKYFCGKTIPVSRSTP